MTFKKWFKNIDTLTRIAIWVDNDECEGEPDYEGDLLEVPWYLLKYKIGWKNPKLKDEPIRIGMIDYNNHKEPILVIHLQSV